MRIFELTCTVFLLQFGSPEKKKNTFSHDFCFFFQISFYLRLNTSLVEVFWYAAK